GITALKYGVCNIQRYDTSNTYPPGYLYVLKSVAYIYYLVKPDLKDSKYFTLLIKLPPLITDLLCGLLLFYYLLPGTDFKKAFYILLLFLFNPAVIVDSAIWGQLDSVPLLLFFLSLFLSFKKKPLFSYIFLTLTVIIKLQYAIFIPFIFELNSRDKVRFQEIIRGISISLITVFIVCLPHIFHNTVNDVVNIILHTPGTFQELSLNAFNLWWLVAKGDGMNASDYSLLLGIITYKKAGFIMFISVFILTFITFYKEKNEEKLIECIALAGFAFFMLLTRMHERYIFPLTFFLAIVFFKDLRYKILYIFLSINLFLSLMIVLHWVYPENNYPLLSLINCKVLSLFLAALNLILFLLFTFYVLRKCNLKPVIVILIFSIIYIISGNICHFKKEVYISHIQELKSSQGWGELHKDTNLEGERIFIKFYPYDYGLSTHSNSTITYKLNKSYTYFKSDLGIGQECGTGGSVIFKVILDKKEVYVSPLVRGWQDPLHIEIPLSGKDLMELVVTDGGDGLDWDHAIWGNGKLYK
ncbi:MAG TPA: NPCBM/NEW2 domain-containing protein, partial [Candidatus Eremiobacteraeota bacterium]|nr:NPCBM/NEW2 domain-containing protein [Candidatus Eremiobacteraeota bacterium]